MDLTILGCGTIIPQKPCNPCSGYLIDKQLLIDCGPGIWHALCKNNINIIEIKHILLSHFHVDHCSDLSAIMLTRYLSPEDIKIPLIIAGPKGLRNWFNQLSGIMGKWVHELAYDLVEISDDAIISGYKIQSAATEHTETSVCYRITNSDGVSLFYSGDSDFNNNLISLAKRSNVALIEASNTQDTKVIGHLTPELAAEIAQTAQVKCLVLTHMYPEVDAMNALTAASKIYGGEIKIAQPGMHIHVE